jgi:poly-beta-1,6-N-acetyl-D-glucosamine synthase
MNETAITPASVTKRNSSSGALSYVLITPARNEAAFIEQTIQSVVAQTARPLRWVIVSDGSTDGTDEIVRKYSARYEWIELVRTPERAERHFAGKARAFNAGYETVKGLGYDVIGSLDADITFDHTYFEFLLSRFAEDKQLGVAGTPFREGDHQYDFRFVSKEHVSGACQMFRRECFDSIGGYIPYKRCIDLVAVTTARMKGWKTRTFVEKVSHHHRKMGSENDNKLMRIYSSGYYDYVFGVHPLWQVVRSIYMMRSKPYVASGCLLFAGYFWAMATRAKIPVSPEFVAFRHKEQMQRFKALLYNTRSAS